MSTRLYPTLSHAIYHVISYQWSVSIVHLSPVPADKLDNNRQENILERLYLKSVCSLVSGRYTGQLNR